MKKIFFIFLIILLAVIFQTSILPLCFSARNIPDVVLILTISAVAVFGFQAVWVWAIISGFILDIFSFSKIGINIFSFAIFSYCVSFFSRRTILGEKNGGILIGAVFILIATFLHNAWIQISDMNFNLQEAWGAKLVFWDSVGWKIILNLASFFIFILILKKIKRKIFPSNKLFTGK